MRLQGQIILSKLLGVEDTTGNYVVYCPLSHEKPEDDWLLDIRLYSEEYRADLISNRIRHIVMTLYRSGCIVRMQTGTLLSVLYHDCIKTCCKEIHFTQEGKKKKRRHGEALRRQK